ncbi:hypothetical protein F4553_003878 [Allocatelliglobosispora scoriae]|uniref:Uncharacterized protein n=1 Tax=Allocatelliglobosispora scoriae TaxID=643052 RepID=A0A841BTL2_9ACTN|nr:hypothetical protein [Allocatelliglobosispora scoriae]MBB5870499.1 hypothetical protein [Allocatelliglobosispora scoriae]
MGMPVRMPGGGPVGAERGGAVVAWRALAGLAGGMVVGTRRAGRADDASGGADGRPGRRGGWSCGGGGGGAKCGGG